MRSVEGDKKDIYRYPCFKGKSPLMEWQDNVVEGVKENAEVFNTLDISLREQNMLLAFDRKA